MTIAAEFAVLIAERPHLSCMIDTIVETSYGCSYLFDGYMACHVVAHNGYVVDVQDEIDEAAIVEPAAHFRRYDSVLSLVLQIEYTLSELAA